MKSPAENFNQDFSTYSAEEVLKLFHTPRQGLSDEEVVERRKNYGRNEIPDIQRRHWIFIFLKNLKSMLVLVLFVAAILAYFTGNMLDVYVIMAVVLLDALISFFQEWKAENAAASLRKILSPLAKVIRAGEIRQVYSAELVPGDIIVVEAGDNIPADARLIEVKNLRTIEASLTGESLPESKSTAVLKPGVPVADQTNMIRKGTFSVSGHGKAIVTATGMNTEIGKVAETLHSIVPEKSHFQKKIDKLATQMGLVSVACAATFFLIGYYKLAISFNELLLISVAAMVSIIPEGLPSIIAIVLAIGANRMTKKKAIIRELSATETLGAVTTIITDKTGTLTENALTVKKVFIPDEEEIEVSGDGWVPEGKFHQGKKTIMDGHYSFNKLLTIAAVSNNSSIRHNKENKSYELLGDPTEGALLVLARKGGLHIDKVNNLDDLPFDSTEKLRATLYKNTDQNDLMIVGAPEKILELSSYVQSGDKIQVLKDEIKNIISDKISDWTTHSMRVVALAYKPYAKTKIEKGEIKELIFSGLTGISDPPRAEVKSAMYKCKQAGIRVIMATGDHKSTAIAIAKEVGIIDEKPIVRALALTEDQLLKFNQEEFDEAITHVNVFARLTPKIKLKIASRLQELGQLIAMTGDGVNDAPALKKADVGIAMGIMGTDVARDSAKVVLADDNFSTIVDAVEEGRIVFKNARQASFYLITTNFAEIVTLSAAIIAGMPMPMTAIQILWLNLVTDGIGDTAVAAERGHGEVMREKPAQKNEQIIAPSIIPFLIINVLIMAILSLAVFHYFLPKGIEYGRSAVFVVMSFTQLFNMYNTRSIKKSVFEIGIFSNLFVTITMVSSIIVTILIIQVESIAKIFGFEAMRPIEFLMLIALSSLVLWAIEIFKYLKKE
jgi:Ca2+-transporting ATPase